MLRMPASWPKPRSWKAAAAAVLLLAAALVSCGGGGGGGASAPAGPAYFDAAAYSSAPDASLPAAAAESAAQTQHTITLPTGAIAYTAHAGHLVARNAAGAAEASFFYVAYTADGQPASARPVTFFYNGGPGSSSVWLHLGSFGPRRLATGDPSVNAATPFPLVDNLETLLDTTDLVFVDAIGTGYSQALAPNVNRDFWSVDRDAAAFRDFVQRWIAVYARAASPKYLFGESYGATRTPILAYLLESAGVHLEGIVLESSALDYASNCIFTTAPVSCAGYLPTYSEAGAWHGVVHDDAPDTASRAQQMRTLTAAYYDPAVAAWLSQHTAPDATLTAALQERTGIAAATWVQDLDTGPDAFRSALLPGRLIGRYDARVAVAANSPLAAGGDPSSSFIAGEFARAIAGYLAGELQYTNPSVYATSTALLTQWDFSHDGRPVPDAIPDLGAVLALAPHLKVLSLNGYYDLATPFLQTERDLARLGAMPNVTLRHYDAGHMTYLDDAARVRMKSDLGAFYAMAAP
jgi:carboxypeptidase C (cathepsin A)